MTWILLLLASVPGVDVPRMVPPDKEFPKGLACYDYCAKRTHGALEWWGREEYCCPPNDADEGMAARDVRGSARCLVRRNHLLEPAHDVIRNPDDFFHLLTGGAFPVGRETSPPSMKRPPSPVAVLNLFLERGHMGQVP